MLALISSSKTMSDRSATVTPEKTSPRFQEDAVKIARSMAQYSMEEIAGILKIKRKLASENYFRIQSFLSGKTDSLQAILAYTGVVFNHIHPSDFTKDDFLFAQKSLRIGSLWYGLLRPCDLIRPYRMEANVKLPEFGHESILQFWRAKQTDLFIDDIMTSGGTLIHLASTETQESFQWKDVEKKVKIIRPEFKIWKNGKMKTLVIYAKMARGEMIRYLIKNRIADPEKLKAFSWDGFSYKEELSTEHNWIFLND